MEWLPVIQPMRNSSAKRIMNFSDPRKFLTEATTATVSAGLFFLRHRKQLVADSDLVRGGRDLPETVLENVIRGFCTCGQGHSQRAQQGLPDGIVFGR
jgi:hypothetical protein